MGEKTPSIQDVIDELSKLARILRVRLGLRALILFGSWARGEQLRESDIDILVVAECFRGQPFYEREFLVYKLYRGKLPIEPWCYTPEEVVEAALRNPRLDVIDALDHGIVVYDDGFWKELRAKAIRWKRTSYGGIALRSRSEKREKE
ncbi:DNA polymerase beta domain protein region [Pyrolobus fumarii 1A]|uniref:DNA polymerase beta domain protein region n=1 Tax=Pyrolobus fumarii (strain DSM 11204 / 1A) TaxID=694429 RepID=G0EH00_PYRF1|nr:nucleotidyltransferase domain-containing protein [Pyrolobus fumarii]AEM38450.1 DNA polymerase beta domain protein region [Pyrolobus fumarii 1A]